MKKIATAITILLHLVSGSAYAETKTPIPRAYEIIANSYGIPPIIFFSVALQESGRTEKSKFLPWPWTLNIDRVAHYFETRKEAEIALMRALIISAEKGTIAKVDVGLGQINMRAHIESFSSPLHALDPTINLNYAASLLARHYVDTVRHGEPDWWEAVGRYHHPSNKKLANKYRSRVLERCMKISSNCLLFGNAHKKR